MQVKLICHPELPKIASFKINDIATFHKIVQVIEQGVTQVPVGITENNQFPERHDLSVDIDRVRDPDLQNQQDNGQQNNE